MLKLRIADVVIHVILVTIISGYLVNIDNRETDMLRYRRETAGDQEPTTPEPVTDPSTDYQGNPIDTNLHGDTGDRSTHTSEMSSSFDSVTDHNNPLYMSRPGESPPRFMSNVQPDQAKTMPEALAPTQEQPTSGSNFQDTPITDTGETGPRSMTQTDSSQDMPRALAQTQDPETSRSPLALPQRQGQAKPKSRQNSDPSQGQKSRPRPRPRPRQRPPPASSRQGAQGAARDPALDPAFDPSGAIGSDVLATAAILNSDVQDTVVDGMEMIAQQKAIERLDQQLSGSRRNPPRQDRPPPRRDSSNMGGKTRPDWGGGQQSSAPRRNSRPSSTHTDHLDTIARVHAAKTQADLVQDHVDTVQDVHQDHQDYLRGGQGYDPRYDYRYGRYPPSYNNNGYNRYPPPVDQSRNNRNGRFPTDQTFDSQQQQNNRNGRFPTDQTFDSQQQHSQYPAYNQQGAYRQYPQYNVHGDGGHYQKEEEEGGYGFEYGQSGMQIDIHTGLPCSNMSDPSCQMRSFGELQIETPQGEMDIEPGEMDLEGPAAADLLRMLGIGQKVAPIHQEININQHVLAALQSRFGINTTAGVRRMSSNRDFQAFMYRVLTHSAPVAPGEYNANLTKIQVDRLLANLDTSKSRLRTNNLDHADLNIQTPPPTANETSKPEAVLTIDGPVGPSPATALAPLLGGVGTPLLGSLPGLASPLVQNNQLLAQAGTVAQPGTVAALVQTVLGGGPTGEEGLGGEAGEGQVIKGTQSNMMGGEAEEGKQGGNTTKTVTGEPAEPSEATGGKENPANETTNVHNPLKHAHAPVTNSSNSEPVAAAQQQIETQPDIINKTKVLSNVDLNKSVPPVQQSLNKSAVHKETDLIGKENNPKLSKDHISKSTNNQTMVNVVSGAAGNGAGTVSKTMTAAGAKTGTGVGKETGAGALAGTNGAGTGAAAGTGAGGELVAGGAGGGAGAGAGAGAGGAGGELAGGGAGAPAEPGDTRPIGLAEAGIDPALNIQPTNQIPTEAIERGTKASTAFAIAAFSLIGLTIIVGPILCLLCKAKEKADQRKRKEKALKNRALSENNIMDAMMLHEFGPEAPNFVANEAQAAMNYYKTDGIYSSIEHDITELEHLKTGDRGRGGHLP